MWDAVSSQNVDSLATLSHFVGRRIKKAYRREARLIYPPVNIEAFPLQEKKGDYYVTVSRLVPYKRVDAIVEAFRSCRIVLFSLSAMVPKGRRFRPKRVPT